MTRTVTATALHDMIKGGGELALVDVREEGPFSDGHLMHAISVPLSHLELQIGDLVPRHAVPVVLCDAGEGLAERAATRLTGLGYTDVAVLEGGIEGWRRAGYEIYAGFNVPSKAFGEFVEHHFGTPSVSAEELKGMIDGGLKMVVLDSRPIEEFNAMSIPTGMCCPGGELVYRVQEIVPEADTTIVVNCAGRTRSIIGAQSLINAGVPNKVVALRNGTMGWHLAGYKVDHGSTRKFPSVSPASVAAAKARAAKVAGRFSVPTVALATVGQWRADQSRTTFVLDVRDPPEFASGHLAGSKNAPGGQLVQATDRYVGVRGARLVVVDNDGVRATMAAHWLIQMNWDAYVLEGGLPATGLVAGAEPAPALELAALDVPTVSVGELDKAMPSGKTVVVDVGLSKDFRKGHIPGAYWAIRARMSQSLQALPPTDRYVFTSDDGLLARFAAADAAGILKAKVAALDGGTKAWRAAGRPLEAGEDRMLDLPEDAWLKPYERKGTIEDFMKQYLSWEIDLVHQIERDDTVSFRAF